MQFTIYIGESDDLDRRLQQKKKKKNDIRKKKKKKLEIILFFLIKKHISDQNHPVNINNATTVKIMHNVRQ